MEKARQRRWRHRATNYWAKLCVRVATWLADWLAALQFSSIITCQHFTLPCRLNERLLSSVSCFQFWPIARFLFTPLRHLKIRKYFFSQRVVNSWNRLPAKVVNSKSVNAFKNAYERLCCNDMDVQSWPACQSFNLQVQVGLQVQSNLMCLHTYCLLHRISFRFVYNDDRKLCYYLRRLLRLVGDWTVSVNGFVEDLPIVLSFLRYTVEIMSSGAPDGRSQQPLNFKIVLLGEGAVGKTSLVVRYVDNKFNDKHISTLQVSAGWNKTSLICAEYGQLVKWLTRHWLVSRTRSCQKGESLGGNSADMGISVV